VLRRLGELTAARDLCEQVLAARRRTLGEEHPDTLTSMNSLALVLYGLGKLADARDLLAQTLAIRRRVLGEEHPDTLTSIDSLAHVQTHLDELGKPENGLAALEARVATYRRLATHNP
jgi:Tetratricopeptide repeat